MTANKEVLVRGIPEEAPIFIPFGFYRLYNMDQMLQEITMSDFRVLNCLMFAAREKNIAKISRKEIKQETNISVNHISSSLTALGLLGILKKLKQDIYVLNPSLGYSGSNEHYTKLSSLWNSIKNNTLSSEDKEWLLPKGAEHKVRKGSLPLSTPPKGREGGQ